MGRGVGDRLDHVGRRQALLGDHDEEDKLFGIADGTVGKDAGPAILPGEFDGKRTNDTGRIKLETGNLFVKVFLLGGAWSWRDGNSDDGHGINGL